MGIITNSKSQAFSSIIPSKSRGFWFLLKTLPFHMQSFERENGGFQFFLSLFSWISRRNHLHYWPNSRAVSSSPIVLQLRVMAQKKNPSMLTCFLSKPMLFFDRIYLSNVSIVLFLGFSASIRLLILEISLHITSNLLIFVCLFMLQFLLTRIESWWYMIWVFLVPFFCRFPRLIEKPKSFGSWHQECD